MSARLDALLEHAEEAMLIARSIFLERVGANEFLFKGTRDYATAVDLEIEEKLGSFFSQITPTIPVLGEEKGEESIGAEVFWALDPIDGTINYSRGLPLCGTSLALVENGTPVIAVVDLPYLDRLYTAVRGSGSMCNGRKIKVSTCERVSQAVVGFGDFSVGQDSAMKNELRISVLRQLSDEVLRVRMIGSAAIDLCWVAEGMLDASITLSNHAWDVQAGALVLKEAGGVVLDADGSPHSTCSKYTIATCSGLSAEIREALNNAGLSV